MNAPIGIGPSCTTVPPSRIITCTGVPALAPSASRAASSRGADRSISRASPAGRRRSWRSCQLHVVDGARVVVADLGSLRHLLGRLRDQVVVPGDVGRDQLGWPAAVGRIAESACQQRGNERRVGRRYALRCHVRPPQRPRHARGSIDTAKLALTLAPSTGAGRMAGTEGSVAAPVAARLVYRTISM